MKESDWKLLRKLKPVLLERLCEHILQECREVIAEEDESAHERYLHLFALLRSGTTTLRSASTITGDLMRS